MNNAPKAKYPLLVVFTNYNKWVDHSCTRLTIGQTYKATGECFSPQGLLHYVIEGFEVADDGFSQYFWEGHFAPIKTNYADATAEILEKFPIVNDAPDKVVTPEKILN